MSGDLLAHLYRQFTYFMEQVTESKFSPAIYYDGNEPKEFSSLLLTHFSNYQVKSYDSISEVIRTYYSSRDLITRIRQKSRICAVWFRQHWNVTARNTTCS